MPTIVIHSVKSGSRIERDMTAEEIAALEAEQAAIPDAPPRRIMGYTILARIEATLGADNAKAALASIQQTDPVGYARMLSSPTGVSVDDQRLIAGAVALGLDPDVILAPET